MPKRNSDQQIEEVGVETEEDATSALVEGGRQAFITSSDWTTETIVSQLRKGNINISPAFQRREVWDRTRKSRLIESIFLNLPVPQIVLAEKTNQPHQYIVLDGKQRLLTIRQFCADATQMPDADFEPLFLSNLQLLKQLNGRSYSSMVSDEQHSGIVDDFDNHTIRTVVIRNWPDVDYLHRVFLRLNTGSVRLSSQELRQALEPGQFTDFLDKSAIASTALQDALGIDSPDFRMRDNEILLRYLAFALDAERYGGNLKRFLDDTARSLNAHWDEKRSIIEAETALCEDTIRRTQAIFGREDSFTSHDGRAFQGRFNRAVFDIMTYFFRDESLADAAMSRRTEIKGAFVKRSNSDTHFQQALTTTTKSLQATSTRFVTWAEELTSVTGLSVEAPKRFVDHLREKG